MENQTTTTDQKNKEYQMTLSCAIDLLKDILNNRAGQKATEYFNTAFALKNQVLGGNKETCDMIDITDQMITDAYKALYA